MRVPTSRVRTIIATILSAFLFALPGCDSGSPEDNFVVTYDPPFDASQFVAEVDNPFFPLAPGTVLTYEGDTEEGHELIVVEVLNDTRIVAGVTTIVVRDRVYLDGALIEDTFDWFAQDEDDNVWYLGEETAEYEDGEVVGTDGSWEAGIDGAEAGIVMPGSPEVGQAYYQEFHAGEAEDRGRILSITEDVTVPAGTFSNCVKTEDTTPLEPDVLEYKYHCPGVGTVLEEDLEDGAMFELQSIDTGSGSGS